MPRKKHIQLSIPQPCEEGRNTMHPVGKDQFCGKCQKVIIDFSGMSDGEIGRILSQPNAPSCGRFRRSQLDRPILYEALAGSRSWPRLAAGAVVLLLGMPHALLAQAPASGSELVSAGHPSTQPSSAVAMPQPLDGDSSRVLNGHLLSAETGMPIGLANVTIPDLGIAVATDDSGFFRIQIPLAFQGDTLDLQIRWVGDLHAVQVSLNPLVRETQVTLALEMQEVLLDGVMIRNYEPPKDVSKKGR